MASAFRGECRFDLGDDGEKGGRGLFEVIAAVAHVGEERLNIEEIGAFRAAPVLARRVRVKRKISTCIECGKHPRSGERHPRVDEDARERRQGKRRGQGLDAVADACHHGRFALKAHGHIGAKAPREVVPIDGRGVLGVGPAHGSQ
ncbi:MAG TPA: hypothetical protein VLL28_01345, partial [Hyphomicrobiaceae bacterium]|nr:hypothetical protein [Hyphomicrobiaceae bacterium]